VHPTCSCYWLANSFSQFLPLDACASVDVLNLHYCIIVLTCILHLPHCLRWVLVISILLTSLSARVDFILSCFVLTCIIVIAYTPQSTVSTGFTLLLIHMSACVRFSLAGRTIYLSIHIVYYYLHIDIDIYCCQSACFHNCWGQSPLPSSL